MQPVEPTVENRVRPIAELTACVVLPDRELAGGARRGSGRVQPIEIGPPPVDAMDVGHHAETAFDEKPSISRSRIVEEAFTQVGGILDGHLPLDEPHDEKGRTHHRGVALVTDERRDRNRRMGRDAHNRRKTSPE